MRGAKKSMEYILNAVHLWVSEPWYSVCIAFHSQSSGIIKPKLFIFKCNKLPNSLWITNGNKSVLCTVY